MSDKEVTIDCTKTCKMTKAIRESAFCTKKATVADGVVKHGCKELLSNEPKELVRLLGCELWDMELYDSCLTCPLSCVNNKNPEIKRTEEERAKLNSLIEQLKPNMILYGITAEQVEKISSTYTKKAASGKEDELGREAIKIAAFANSALKSIMSGGRVDLAFLTLYARKSSALAKNFKKEKK